MVQYTQPFVLTTIEGNFTSTPVAEIWRTTFKIPLSTGVVPTPATLLTYLTTISPLIETFHSSPEIGAGTIAQYTGVSAAVIGTDGKYVGEGSQDTVRYTKPSPLSGQGTIKHSLEAALCLSFHTTKARGRASRGRMYWPAVAITLDTTDGRVPAASQTSITSRLRTMIDGINGVAIPAFGGFSYVSVMSGLGVGTTSLVASVSVGRKLDHMSSREGKLSEAHVWLDLNSTRAAADDARDLVHQQMVDQLERESARA